MLEVDDPRCPPHGVVVRVEAAGVCRSDWHAWQGHDEDVAWPHVPGHELAGVVVEVGADVRRWHRGDRVTTPFVTACGTCPECLAGAQQVCRDQTQPGFTGWGAFAERVSLDHADVNLVALDDALSSVDAAALGCRVATAFRAVTDVARVRAGEQVVVHGAGGVGLSVVAVATAAGARVVALDPSPGARDLAAAMGAAVALDPGRAGPHEVAAMAHEATEGGAHVALDAVGSPATCEASVRSLRRRGRHVQVGLLPAQGGRPLVPMDLVVAHELVVLGSHGMAAHDYPRLLRLVRSGAVPLTRLVTRRVPLEGAPAALADVGRASVPGVTVVRP